MKIGAIWDAKVIHSNYILRGKMVVADGTTLSDDTTPSQEANETTLSFAINDAVLTLGEDDCMPKVGDQITVELTTKVIMGCVFEVGSINLRLTDVIITDIDKLNNLCVTAKLTAEHLYDALLEKFGVKNHKS